MKTASVWLLAVSLMAWIILKFVERARVRRLVLLLSEPDDQKLVSSVFDQIRATRDTDASAAAWPEHERAVALAIETSAIVGNGGFSFLFGSELVVDPTYLLSLRALDAVGADAAAQAYRDALALFPNGSVPADLERRRSAIVDFDEAELAEVDDRFMDAQPDLAAQVGAYVRARRAEFEAEWIGSSASRTAR